VDFSAVLRPPLAEALAARGIREPSPVQAAVIPLLLEETAPVAGAVAALAETPPAAGAEAAPDTSAGATADAGLETPADAGAADAGAADAGVVAAAAPLRLLFTAPTGTGKTLAYLLPLVQRLAGKQEPGGGPRFRGPEVLVLAPTHELCSQIKSELDCVLRALDLPPAQLLIGSVSLGRQIEGLKKNKPRAAAGNPARVLQLVRMKKLSLESLRFLVLDEGDRLMAEELYRETRELVSLAGGNSGIIACSATMNEKNRDALFGLEEGPWRIVEENGFAVLQRNIEHWAFFAEDRKKLDLLKSFLTAARPKKALVFTARGGEVGRIVSRLQYRHVAAGGIQGDMDKRARKAAIDGFRKGTTPVLVASDLACRGLDVEGISHVISLDTGDNAEAYLHRAGRTGRAGRRGIMVSIGNEEELRRLQRIEKKLKITVYPKELYGGRIMKPDAAGLT
jgi:superfamily II DNA/RNA helicase